MKKRLKPLIIGNWKANPATIARAEKILVDVQKGLVGRKGQSEIAVAAPVLFVGELKALAGSQKIEFVAQDVSSLEEGAHTGEVTVAMLRSMGVKAAIVGHSERRARGESDAEINLKVKALHAAKSTAIICVGESQRDGTGDYFNTVEEQLTSGLVGIEPENLKHLVVAYEPVWAIGTGKHATAAEAEEMRLFIHKVLSDIFPREEAETVRVIYGGSVSPENVEGLLSVGRLDGFLVGGASLVAKDFVEIVKIADQYARLA